MRNYHELPADLRVPQDDGAADHLPGLELPDVKLGLASGGSADLRSVIGERSVIFVYPRTGTPGVESPDGWDQIPGARGCTPQSCAYRDRISEFEDLGVGIFGLSSQPIEEQEAFRVREGIPYEILNDSELQLAEELRLPTFTSSSMRLYRRLTIVAKGIEIRKAFYPVFPPDRNAQEVLEWLRRRD